MTIRLLVFAHLADDLGFRERTLNANPGETPRQLLQRAVPAFDCASARVALDEEYASWDQPLGTVQVVALIPPVSGG